MDMKRQAAFVHIIENLGCDIRMIDFMSITQR